MKRTFLSLMCVVMIAGVSSARVDTPNINGATGLVRMPTADILGPRDYSITVDYGALAGSSTSKPLFSYKVALGSLSGKRNGLELSFVGMSDPVLERIKEGVFVNMKYSMTSDDDELALAVGVENLSSYNNTDTYLVASKYFRGGAGLHFGAMFDFPNSRFRPMGMLGLNMPLGSNYFNLMAEVLAGETAFQANAGLSLDLNRQFSILVRALNLGNNLTAKDAQSYYAGLCIKNLF